MERSVLITGCSSGIGRATAHAFQDAGWDVIATARDPEDLDSLADRGMVTTALDVTDQESIEAAVSSARGHVGHIDCLVNNAGYTQIGVVEDIPASRLHRQFDVNVYGPHRLIREVLPEMRERGTGTIITLSSVAGQLTIPGFGAYSASKKAMGSLHDALRTELEPTGVNVVLVEPGPVKTQFRERAARELDEMERTESYNDIYSLLEDWIAFDRVPGADPPERVANTIVTAASAPEPEARYTIGQVATLGGLARFLPSGLRDTLFGVVRRAAGVRRS